MEDNVLFFESHYEVQDSEIIPEARNIASESMVQILNSVLDKAGVKEEYYEIKLIIPKYGCYQDTIKVKFKSEKILPWLNLIVSLYLLFFSDKFDIANKKLDLIDRARKLGFDCDNPDYQDIMKNVCKDIGIKKALSKKYTALDKDKNLKSENLIMKKDKDIVFNTKIQRKQFKDFEYSAKEKIYSENFDNIIIELVSPVLNYNSKRLWAGIYNGNTIKSEDIPILVDGDTISFSMEDDDFKQLIQDKQISFSQGDYVYANLEISGILNYDDNVLKKRKIKVLSIYKATDKQKKEIKNNFINKEIQNTPLFNHNERNDKK